jgi:uncharacterized membrane protein YfcA
MNKKLDNMKYPESLFGIGLIVMSVAMSSVYTLDAPHFVAGFGAVVGIATEFVGVYLYKRKEKQDKARS